MNLTFLCLMQVKMNKLHFGGYKACPFFFLSSFIKITSTAPCGLKLNNFTFILLMTCFSSQVDFTSCGGLLCILAVLLTIIGIVTAIVLSFQYVRIL